MIHKIRLRLFLILILFLLVQNKIQIVNHKLNVKVITLKISTRLKDLSSKISREITFDQLLHDFHKKDNFFLIILLAIPPATPLSFIPGFSALFGACIALICIQLFLGRTKMWFPAKLKNQKVPNNIKKEF